MKTYLSLKAQLSVVEEYKGLAIVGGYKGGTYKIAPFYEDNGKTYIQTGAGLHSYTSIEKAEEKIDYYFANLEKMKAGKWDVYSKIHY